MPLTPAEEEVVAQWLRSARSDLAYAGLAPPPEGMYEQACFHAQQAAEKALKGLLLSLGEDPPFTHDIEALVNMLREVTDAPDDLISAAVLSIYAVATRYPPFDSPLTEEKWQLATQTARRVVEWVEQQLHPE